MFALGDVLQRWKSVTDLFVPPPSDVSLGELAAACQKANVHHLAIVLRQIVVSRRGRWEVDDQAFIRRSLEQLLDAKGVEVALRNFPSGPAGGFDLCERHH
jgi:hypothetical protein